MDNNRVSLRLIASLFVGGFCCIWVSTFFSSSTQREALLTEGQNVYMPHRAQQSLVKNVLRLHHDEPIYGRHAPFVALEEVSDFPDLDEDKELKDTSDQVQDIYRQFEPTDTAKFSDAAEFPGFYSAFQDTRLPQKDARGAWRPESESLGGGGAWPPAAYPWDPAYYPPAAAPALSSITINANGPGSTNYFNVAGPQAINVHVGPRVPADSGSVSYYYPGAGAAVPYEDEAPTAEMQEVAGGSTVRAEAAVAQAVPPPLTVDSDGRLAVDGPDAGGP
uniref:Uncharacterized protein n=1 Tax=Cryptomonas curvata TaxID=233186 RepID=A0A7S0N968_9CRYP|mmetsp:Transcript_8890/g.19085  ORF Transcript_8890/g.19085 Transcript_8890/m.19085 type:complete len:277 (+) Transcript_8890:47-877(+)